MLHHFICRPSLASFDHLLGDMTVCAYQSPECLRAQEDFLPSRDAEASSPVHKFRQVLAAWVPCLVRELEFCLLLHILSNRT